MHTKGGGIRTPDDEGPPPDGTFSELVCAPPHHPPTKGTPADGLFVKQTSGKNVRTFPLLAARRSRTTIMHRSMKLRRAGGLTPALVRRMSQTFQRNKPHLNIGTIGHVDHGDAHAPNPCPARTLAATQAVPASPRNRRQDDPHGCDHQGDERGRGLQRQLQGLRRH